MPESKQTCESSEENVRHECLLQGHDVHDTLDAQEKSVDVEQELTECKNSLRECQDKYVRLSADLENFKRRISKEQATWAHEARAKLIVQLLATVDNFDRAMEHHDPDQQSLQEMKEWARGITLTHRALTEFLKHAGVQEVSYDLFDPTHHEALLQVESPEHATGHIVRVLQKGYLLNDRVIRPARVTVAK